VRNARLVRIAVGVAGTVVVRVARPEIGDADAVLAMSTLRAARVARAERAVGHRWRPATIDAGPQGSRSRSAAVLTVAVSEGRAVVTARGPHSDERRDDHCHGKLSAHGSRIRDRRTRTPLRCETRHANEGHGPHSRGGPTSDVAAGELVDDMLEVVAE